MKASEEEENESRKLTDLEIIDDVLLLLLNGYETAATALSHAFGLLATHPEIQVGVFFYYS